MAQTCAIIAAVDERGGIGLNGQLPWHLPKDMERFKELTLGSTVVMGRKTFESLPGMRPLPGRDNIVISSTMSEQPGVAVMRSIYDAIYGTPGSVFFIGGTRIYQAALPYCTKMYLTKVRGNFACDVKFPAVDWRRWNLEAVHHCYKDEKHKHDFSFEEWRRFY